MKRIESESRYEYLSRVDSDLSDRAKASTEPFAAEFAAEVVRLLELLAEASRQAHRNSWQ